MSETLRVVVVTPGFLPEQGGVEMHTGRLVAELAARGVDVRVLTARRGLRRTVDETYRADDPHGGVPVRVHPAWRTTVMSISPRLLLAGLRAFRSADLVHVHSYHAACGFAAVSGRFAPVVLTPHYHGGGHSPAAVALHRVYRLAGRAIFGSARAVICVSSAERRQIAADFPATTPRTHVIPNGVDTAAVSAAEPFAGEPPTVLSVGRLEPYKGVAVTVRAMRELPAESRLVVIGEGSQRAELEKLTADLGLTDRVRFLGHVDTTTLHRWLRTARVLVSLSAHEAFGLAPVEAACAGARSVLSDIPAHREITADHLGGTARLVPMDGDTAEPAAVVAALAEQLAAPRTGGLDVPDWSRVAELTLGLYRQIVPADRQESSS